MPSNHWDSLSSTGLGEWGRGREKMDKNGKVSIYTVWNFIKLYIHYSIGQNMANFLWSVSEISEAKQFQISPYYMMSPFKAKLGTHGHENPSKCITVTITSLINQYLTTARQKTRKPHKINK